MLAFVNKEFIEESEATLGIGDLAIQRGYGVFDFFRTRDGVAVFVDDYLDRFFNSAAALRLKPLHTKDEIKSIVQKLITSNNAGDSGFRMILTGGYSPDSFEPASPNFIIIQQPIELPTAEKYNTGLKVILHEYQRELPAAKSINYLIGIYLRDKIIEQNADDVLYYKNGKVLELPRSNVFIVTRDRVVVTPMKNVLAGITRKWVLKAALKHYKVEERDITLDELKAAAEVFMTSTTKRIIPITAVDGVAVGNGKPGPVTSDLLSAFVAIEEQYYNSALEDSKDAKHHLA